MTITPLQLTKLVDRATPDNVNAALHAARAAIQSRLEEVDALLAELVDLTADVTGVLPIANGGTGQATATLAFNALSPLTTQGDILYNDGTNDVRLAKSSTATRYLANTGTTNNPAWDQVNLANGVTGQLPMANGGTGANLADPNADRILFWDDSAGAITFLAASTGLTITTTNITTRLTVTATASGSINFGNILAGADGTSNVTLTGYVSATDQIEVTWGGPWEVGLHVYVTNNGDDNVTITARNNTASTINPANNTYLIRATRFT